MTQNRIIIVGFMGAGKSTVARALAQRLRSTMIDLDSEIERTEGRSPKHIIEQEGEAAFRKIESSVLEQVLKQHTAQVIALGGGAWTLRYNRDLISKDGATSVWLDVPFDVCWQRILKAGKQRPLAQNEAQARALYEERMTAYSIANLHLIASEEKPAELIADEVIQALTHFKF